MKWLAIMFTLLAGWFVLGAVLAAFGLEGEPHHPRCDCMSCCKKAARKR